jgi:O-antigen/teichoic acid export membrane protein
VGFLAGTASDAADRARLSRKFRLSGAAQYMHSLVDTAPLLIVARWSTSVEAGLFAFAFNLAAQANAVIGIKLAGVLQPILANLAHSGERQAMGFLRTIRVLGAVVVPVCLCQAVVAQPLFAAVFPERWQPAAAIFAVLSMCEALFFAAAPTMAMLKAQGRFRLFLIWQGVHFIVLVAILPMVASVWGALGVAVANMLLWAVSLPMVVALAVRPSGVAAGRALAVFLVPWCCCAPFALAAWAGIDRLQSWGTTGTWLSLLVVGPAAFAAMMFSLRWYQPETYHELSSIAGRLLGRVRRVRG